MKNVRVAFVVIILLLNGCGTRPYAGSNKKYKKQARSFAKIIRSLPKDSIIADSLKLPPYWIGTTNFGMRKPNYVIIHHTAQNSCDKTLQTFTQEKAQVSAHYVICRDGTLHHMLNDYLRAWHAGAAKWGNETDINSSSIGIELDNNGLDTFSNAQLNTLLGLLSTLKKNYHIPAANFIGHADIAPARKDDPNIHFPWKYFAEKGFGLWYSDTTNIIVPADFNAIHALRIIGYDVSNINSTIKAFRRHFLQAETTGELTEAEKKVLFVLMGRYL
jgi:N-acetylmuramoyl-L-alanine amidase